MTNVVLGCYRPKKNKQQQLLRAVRRHVPTMQAIGLATARPGLALQAKNGSIVEIFQWKSAQAARNAHKNPVVQELWREFDACCTYIPLKNIPEARELFAEFKPIKLKSY